MEEAGPLTALIVYLFLIYVLIMAIKEFHKNAEVGFQVAPNVQNEYLVTIDSTATGEIYYKCNVSNVGMNEGVVYLKASQTILYGETDDGYPRIIGQYDDKAKTFIPLSDDKKIRIYVPLKSINNEKNIKADIRVKN